MATESPEQAALATSDPTPTHHDGGHSIGNKLKTGVKSGLDRLQHEFEIKEAPHHAYVDSGDARNVRLPRDLIISADELCNHWSDYLERKAIDEKGDFTELEVIIRKVAPKVRKWANFLEGGHAPGENDHLTQADLDAVYYLLMNEVEQRGSMMGYEVFLHPTRRGWQPEAQQFAATRRGVETPYTKYLAAHGQDRAKIKEDLEKWEGVRIKFEQALTGRGFRDRIFDRANWGICRTSMFRRDRSELRLHTEILHALENSDEPVIRNFIATHGHIQRVSDLLVTLDSPAERNIAIRAYHEAISKASAKRFQLKAGDLLEKLLESREKVWEEEGWIKTAEENLLALEGEGQLTREQKTELDALRTDMTKVRDLLRGKRDEQGQLQGGLPARLQQLQESVLTLHTYTTDPEHNLVTIKADRDNHKDRQDAYTKGQLPAADVPQELTDLKTIMDALKTELTNVQVALPAAPTPADKAVIRELQSRVQQSISSYNEAKGRYSSSEQEQLNSLNSKITTIEGEISTKETVIRDSYKFIETEIPDFITTITDLKNRLTRLTTAPSPVAAHITPHIAQLTAQIAHLNNTLTFLNGMLTGGAVAGGVGVMSAVRKGQGETISVYAARYNFYLPQDQFRDVVILPFEDEIKLYDEIKKGVNDEERETKIKGIHLIQHIAGVGEGNEGTLGKTISRNLAEGQDRRILTEIRNTHSLAPVRDAICNHSEILRAKKKDSEGNEVSLGIGDTLLWKRVFSDVFILQSYVEWSVRRGGLIVPPPPAGGAADFNLETANDPFRKRVIEKMTSNHIEFGQFLNYLVEKRLRDAGERLEVKTNLREASGTSYGNHDIIGPAATIFTVENNAKFAARVRSQEPPYYISSVEGEIDNIGIVRHTRSGFVHYLNIVSPSHDPLVLDLADAGAAVGAPTRKRNIPISIQLRTTRGGRTGRFRVSLQADPSLQGLGINTLGRLDRRWVDIGNNIWHQIPARGYGNFGNLLAQINTLIPNVPQVDVGNYILRSLGGYFLELSPTQRLTEFGRFPDAAIIPANFPSLTNPNLGFQRISLDSSGVVELVRTVGGATTRISIDSALEGEFDIAGARRRLNATEAEELIRLTGEHVFNIVRR
ncbi:hypothetical protein A3D03_00185 [Candidatus Gottesmanbacteria bacterium RIFCSPHIGHO2_02_FULL_40_13]|uniref:Uncharacterized protein n=1 Tax=Candidatus Gottesmanbacteria bacterium RIFCSPHIGHO2_02_FULL_40_13 TaxID=1798384 RepID=A0A1F6AE44_9BACT|nr:MAG: hypothetical protein A3D03_00185 [Candidatus Gottesmanbacteria bacterium RIFCSPHIGHO2_02_FULL_40_13]